MNYGKPDPKILKAAIDSIEESAPSNQDRLEALKAIDQLLLKQWNATMSDLTDKYNVREELQALINQSNIGLLEELVTTLNTFQEHAEDPSPQLKVINQEIFRLLDKLRANTPEEK